LGRIPVGTCNPDCPMPGSAAPALALAPRQPRQGSRTEGANPTRKSKPPPPAVRLRWRRLAFSTKTRPDCAVPAPSWGNRSAQPRQPHGQPEGPEGGPQGSPRRAVHTHQPRSNPAPYLTSAPTNSGCPEGSALGALPGREGLGGSNKP